MATKAKKLENTISPDWTPNRRKAVEEYIVELQRVLRLQDWNIKVDWTEPCDEISLATNDPLEDQKCATIRVSDKFLPLSASEQTQTLVHEMIHCHLNVMTDLAEYAVKSLAKKEANEMFLIAFSQSLELTTDALADAYAPLIKQFVLPEKEVVTDKITDKKVINGDLSSPKRVAKKARKSKKATTRK